MPDDPHDNTQPSDARALERRADSPSAAVVLWGTNEPTGMTRRMSAIADAISDVLTDRKLTVQIGDNKYVKVEGWSMVGAMLAVFPRTVAVECIETGYIDAEEIEKRGRNGPWTKRFPAVSGNLSYRAEVELISMSGQVVGGAISYCSKHEEQWRDRDDNQVASMSQTRATAKAYRQSFGFVMPMAGYEATPAEEMGEGDEDGHDAPVRQQEARDGSVPPAMRNIGDLLNWANRTLGLRRDEVLKRLGVANPADIRDYAAAATRLSGTATAQEEATAPAREVAVERVEQQTEAERDPAAVPPISSYPWYPAFANALGVHHITAEEVLDALAIRLPENVPIEIVYAEIERLRAGGQVPEEIVAFAAEIRDTQAPAASASAEAADASGK